MGQDQGFDSGRFTMAGRASVWAALAGAGIHAQLLSRLRSRYDEPVAYEVNEREAGSTVWRGPFTMAP